MVKLNGATLRIHVRLLGSISIEGTLCRRRCRSVRISWDCRNELVARIVWRRVCSQGLHTWVGMGAWAAMNRSAELSLGALDTVLHGNLPVRRPLLAHVRLARAGRALGSFGLQISRRADRMNCRSRRGRDPNAIRVVLETALDPIARGEEGVEALDQVRVACEKI